LYYDDEKSKCQPYWDIIKKPSSSLNDVINAQQKLSTMENRPNSFHSFDEARFFYHKESKTETIILTGIHNLSGKPNTSNGIDSIGMGDFSKNMYGITTSTGFVDGTFNWNISQTYWPKNGDNNTRVQDFSSIDQNFIIDKNGTVSAIKGNASGAAALNAPTSSY
jgi:hypothetical protein